MTHDTSPPETADVAPKWSVDLPTDAGGWLTWDPGGRCLVSFASSAASFGMDGRREWLADTPGRALGAPIIAPGERVIRIEGETIVTRDARSGSVIHRFQAPGGSGLALSPWGDPVYRDSSANGQALLRCVTMMGEPRWSTPLLRPGLIAPFALGELVVFSDNGALKALDQTGSQRWIAKADVPNSAAITVAASPSYIDPETALLRVDEASRIGFYLLQKEGRLRPYPSPPGFGTPLAVIPHMDGGFGVVMAGPRIEVRQMDYRWTIGLLNAQGTEEWRHTLHAKPQTMVAGPDGGVAVAASPSRKRWDDYHRWQDLSAQAFVRYLTPAGSERWTWYAPGPISHYPLIAPDGTVLVASEGKLFALPTR
jgi:hypothetical protein